MRKSLVFSKKAFFFKDFPNSKTLSLWIFTLVRLILRLILIQTSPQGNVKQFLRLTTTQSPAKTVLGIRKAVLDKAGVGDFAGELRSSGFEVTDRKNMRYLKKNHHVLQ